MSRGYAHRIENDGRVDAFTGRFVHDWEFDGFGSEEDDPIVGKLSIKSKKKRDEGPFVKDLIPGQIFRFAGSVSKHNIYMVVDPKTVAESRRRDIHYVMLKNGKMYSSSRTERKRVILVSASLTLDE